jgi:hypothetical protein
LQKISLYALFTHRQERGKVIFLFWFEYWESLENRFKHWPGLILLIKSLLFCLTKYMQLISVWKWIKPIRKSMFNRLHFCVRWLLGCPAVKLAEKRKRTELIKHCLSRFITG